MIDIMTRLRELNQKHASDEEYKKFLGSLSEEMWQFVRRDIPATPYLGKLGKLRKESLEEKNRKGAFK